VKTAGFWKADSFLGLAAAIALFPAAVPGGSQLIKNVERAAYDMGVRTTNRTPSDRISIIATDEPSLPNLARWPWPRDLQE
jgi:serine/threonine-protein kinase